MARREVPTFEGTPTLTEAKVEAIMRLFATAMGDEDKASDLNDMAFYEGWAEALKWVLGLLYADEEEGEGHED